MSVKKIRRKRNMADQNPKQEQKPDEMISKDLMSKIILQERCLTALNTSIQRARAAGDMRIHIDALIYLVNLVSAPPTEPELVVKVEKKDDEVKKDDE